MGAILAFLPVIDVVHREQLPNLTPVQEKSLCEQYMFVKDCFIKKEIESKYENKNIEELIADLNKIWNEDTKTNLSKVVASSDISEENIAHFEYLRDVAYCRMNLIKYDPNLSPLTEEESLAKQREALENKPAEKDPSEGRDPIDEKDPFKELVGYKLKFEDT